MLVRKRPARAPATLAPTLVVSVQDPCPVATSSTHRSNFSVLSSVNLLVLIKTVKQVILSEPTVQV